MSDTGYRQRIARLHRELGISSTYAETRGLSLQNEASDASLVDIGVNPDGQRVRLVGSAAAAWEKMQRAAAVHAIELVPLSGFRPVARQVEIIRAKLCAGQPLEEILRFVAAPGYSEHHTGCAIDVGARGQPLLEESFAETQDFRWLQRRAAEFGFRLSYPRQNSHGFGFEPWHWCWSDGAADARL